MRRLLLLSLLLPLCLDGLPACQVPVFRFALERWPADPFRLLVAHDAELSDDFRGALHKLRSQVAADPPALNLTVEVLDLTELSEIERVSTPGLEFVGEGASLVLFPPASWRREEPVWTGKATRANLDLILDSPARRQCAAHLLAGESAVWLLVNSGDAERDENARRLLADSLREAMATLEIPEGVLRPEELATRAGMEDIDLDDVLRSKIPLKISFVIEEVDRGDPAEALFLDTLAGPAGARDPGPQLIPVFGRGRTPGPLPASLLSKEAILSICEYLCGSCSCQVKQGNPGYDLLFRTDWDGHLNPTVISAEQFLDVVTFGDSAPASSPSGSLPPLRGPRWWPVVLVTILSLLGSYLGYRVRRARFS